MFWNAFKPLVRVAPKVRALCMPWLLLATRVWFGQVVLVHQIMAMAQGDQGGLTGAGLHAPSSVEAALHGIVPLLLTAGLLTRPIALVLLVGGYGSIALGPGGATLVLLAWLVVLGPGTFSLDAMLARGLAWAPLGPARQVRKCYELLERFVSPVLLLFSRAGIAASLSLASALTPSLFGQAAHQGLTTLFAYPSWIAALLAFCIAFGCMTRLAMFIYAAMVPLAGIAMAMDDRLAILLLLLMFVATGPGVISVDHWLARWVLDSPDREKGTLNAYPHVVVVGGGFGGIETVRGLRNSHCRITLIDQRNHHLFQPLLYQIATAALSPGEIATPIRSLFRGQRNVQVRLGTVTGIDTATREVLIGTASLKFDYLVLATGARHSYFGNDHWAPYAPGLKSIEDATSIRSRLLRAFEEAETAADAAARAAWLTFVIVGGGPTGIELAGAIAELAHHGMDQEYRAIDPSTSRVILVHAGPRVLPTFPPSLSAAAERSLRKLGVTIYLDTRVLGVDQEGADLGKDRIASRTILWAAGVAASPVARWLKQPEDASGRIKVNDDLSVPAAEGIFAIGDAASSLGWNGVAVPGLAPAAKQQGRYAARVINAQLAGRRRPPPFRYRHFGSLATIGRQAAVAEIGPIRMWGAPAWWFWGAAHIAFLTGGPNRVKVMLDWFWAYVTYRRSARLITGPASDRQPD
ncbi:NAD(P)/FAD-dependent oxidoreductase [Paraburkholderia sp. CNPSo 3281]|uniref:NAD(P)/FAD-dependent oxidoreductase n=1 Tax=Paraburkholderia sp. CNPSo 3281 TaxID=2940933 RepID=UPI0020B86F52|nr:NAD(P)/FAD-dependent oxidoreductase [Paraburkholderia sp. CNPSo 3281]MCP3716295.1 NAD(P)/FAD-dependent oxidoreductase [Paraburkholderia sp. CNPSo 3281]